MAMISATRASAWPKGLALLGGTLLAAGCYAPAYISEVETTSVTARNGDVAELCLDTRVTPDYGDYIHFDALPDLTKASFEALAPEFREWSDGGKVGIGKYFYDNTDSELKVEKFAPMRRCWTDGDPRESGLQRHYFSFVGDTGEVDGVMYHLYFDGERMVYAEGWTEPYSSWQF